MCKIYRTRERFGSAAQSLPEKAGAVREIKRNCKRQKGNAMEETITVSVLIALYEPDGDWLEAQLRSVAKQSFQDFEVRILDDASQDAGFEAAKKICSRVFGDRKHVFISRKAQNTGSDQTFEQLAKSARGKYLAFCDQDDIWEPHKLERLVRALAQGHAVMAYSDMSVIRADGTRQYRSLRQLRPGIVFAQGEGQTAYYVMDNCTAACSMLVKQTAVYRAMPFPQGICCDQWIAACAAAQGRIVFLDEPLVRYRRHGANQTASFGHISGKQDYYRLRVLPALRLAGELKKRGLHYPFETEVYRCLEARRRKDMRGIWKYRAFSRRYALLDLMMLCLPDVAVRKMIRLWKAGPKGNRIKQAVPDRKIPISRAGGFAGGKTGADRDTVVAVMAVNRAYMPVLSVSLASIAAHAGAVRKYRICVFHTDIPQKDIRIVQRAYTRGNFQILFIDVSQAVQGRRLKGKGQITAETYFRFLIPWILGDTKKAVYLDADTVVCKDLAQLFDTDMQNCLLGAVPELDLIGQYHGANPDTRQYCDRVLQLADPDRYFQAGVLLWNTAAWREQMNLRQLLDLAEHGNYRYSDQDILNMVCEGRVKRLGMEWNVLAVNGARKQVLAKVPGKLLETYRHARQQPGIIHYAGSGKPWKEPDGDFAQEFWEAARGTPYYEQLLQGMCLHALRKERRGMRVRAADGVRRAAKRLLPADSLIRRAAVSIYWSLK